MLLLALVNQHRLYHSPQVLSSERKSRNRSRSLEKYWAAGAVFRLDHATVRPMSLRISGHEAHRASSAFRYRSYSFALSVVKPITGRLMFNQTQNPGLSRFGVGHRP